MTTSATDTADATSRAAQAMAIVRHHTILCAESMWIPWWWASSPSITVLQLKMLTEVSRVYGIDVDPDRAKAIVASLGGGFLSLVIAQPPLSIAAKAWGLASPVVGIPLRFGTGPAIRAAYTWFLGRAFVDHHEAGGTYHDFRMTQVVAR